MSIQNFQGQDETLTVKISGMGFEQVFFKIKAKSTFRRMMERYVQRIGVKDLRLVNFLLNGDHINPNQTPDQVGLQHGDEIEVVAMQTGGGENER